MNNCKNIKNYNLAISNSNNITEYYSKGRQRNSLEKIINTFGEKKITESISLDKIIEIEKIKEIDLIYVTVNGSEHKVLEGLSNNVYKVKYILIVSEYIKVSFDLLVQFLKKNNFTIQIINKNIYAKNNIF